MVNIVSMTTGGVVVLSDGNAWRVLSPDIPKLRAWPHGCVVFLEEKDSPLEIWSHKMICGGQEDYVRVMPSQPTL